MNRPPLVAGGQGRHAREAIASATALAWAMLGAVALAVYVVIKVFA